MSAERSTQLMVRTRYVMTCIDTAYNCLWFGAGRETEENWLPDDTKMRLRRVFRPCLGGKVAVGQ
jgi:hypothetical protein